MKSFPMFIRTSQRKVLIIGGGEQAAQKTRLLLKTDADLVILAAELEDELQGVVNEGRAKHVAAPSPAVFKGSAMVFIGTGCPALDASMHALSKAFGVMVNVVDQPELCDMTTPAIVDRDPIVVAIGSEGTAPVLTRDIKTRLEEMLPVNIGGLAALAGRLRPSVSRHVPRAERRAFWAWVFKGGARQDWVRGAERQAAKAIKQAIAKGGAPQEDGAGHIALVGAGPGSRDLLTLRAVERLQEADVVYFDRLVDPEVLELARRDAERVYVGKHVGAHDWPQDRINKVIVSAALSGRKVVRLKSGDPGIFGRANEELEAARAAGIAVEIVPGVTAASAAAASLGQSLTVRGETDALVVATASGCSDNPAPECVRLSGPGTTTAFYMGARHADRISKTLIAQGLPSKCEVAICVDVSKRTERKILTSLSELPNAVDRHGVTGGAIILVSWPKAVEPQLERILPPQPEQAGHFRAIA